MKRIQIHKKKQRRLLFLIQLSLSLSFSRSHYCCFFLNLFIIWNVKLHTYHSICRKNEGYPTKNEIPEFLWKDWTVFCFGLFRSRWFCCVWIVFICVRIYQREYGKVFILCMCVFVSFFSRFSPFVSFSCLAVWMFTPLPSLLFLFQLNWQFKNELFIWSPILNRLKRHNCSTFGKESIR